MKILAVRPATPSVAHGIARTTRRSRLNALGRNLAGSLLVALAAAGTQGSTALASGTPAWGTGVEAVLPGGAATNPNVNLDNVSCPSAGGCSAIGDYDDGSGR